MQTVPGGEAPPSAPPPALTGRAMKRPPGGANATHPPSQAITVGNKISAAAEVFCSIAVVVAPFTSRT